MKRLLAAGNLYLKKMDLTDVALLKLCMGSLGVLIGLSCAKRHRKSAGFFAGFLFTFTWIPVVCKFLHTLTNTED